MMLGCMHVCGFYYRVCNAYVLVCMCLTEMCVCLMWTSSFGCRDARTMAIERDQVLLGGEEGVDSVTPRMPRYACGGFLPVESVSIDHLSVTHATQRRKRPSHPSFYE